MKDQNLLELSRQGNVAQFVSFAPTGHRRIALLRGGALDSALSPAETVGALLTRSEEKLVNIRTFANEGDNRSMPFEMRIASIDAVLQRLRAYWSQGLYTVVNESIDVQDGGVSGVAMASFCEVVPGKTPRGVEEAGVARLPRAIAARVLSRVYQADIAIPGTSAERVEFSVHPRRRGVRHENVLVWASEPTSWEAPTVRPLWPNVFSQHIGDKVFGLLIAEACELPVPYTVVTSRRVASFVFGSRTHSCEWWIRTAPATPEPGHFPTYRGWHDPFKLMGEIDGASRIASILAQEGVEPAFAGGAFVDAEGMVVVDGVAGAGDLYMLGEQAADALPQAIVESVARLMGLIRPKLGDVRIEWVHDGSQPWLVQVHVGRLPIHGDVIREGACEGWFTIDASLALPLFRAAIESAPPNHGIAVDGDIGLASHKMEVVIKAGRPARLVRKR